MNLSKISSKVVLCILTILFWGAAAGLGYIGANIFMTYEKYGDLVTYLHSVVPAIIVLGVALLMFLIGVIGVCGLFSENRCLLGTYFTLLTILLALEVASVVLLFLFRHSVQLYVKELFSDILKKYGTANETGMSQNFDYIQFKLGCCGEHNYTDWQRTWWYANSPDRWGNVPQSCCVNFEMNTDSAHQLLSRSSNKKTSSSVGLTSLPHYCTGTSPQPTQLDNYYQAGCYTKIRAVLSGRFVYISGIILALIIIQFTGLISTCILMFCRNKHMQQPPYINIATHEDAHYNL